MTMIERVARALAPQSLLPEHMWREFVEPARAAIEAMREPTEEMRIAGDTAPTAHGWGLHAIHGSSEFAECEPLWRAMIDAALGEAEMGPHR